MGLARGDEADWIAAGHLGLLPIRWALLEERHEEVCAALPDTQTMGQEALAMLVAHLVGRFPQRFSLQEAGGRLLDKATGSSHDLMAPSRHPLERAARLVAEDLCLLASAAPDEPYRLVAACVCFPSRWLLAHKIGQTLGAIHQPVPCYQERLAAPMDRFFARLRPGMIMRRTNWTIHDSAALCQPQPPPAVTPQVDCGQFFVRSESQTLRRLPETGAILFTILTRLCPLADFLDEPTCAAALWQALDKLPAEVIDYRGLAPYRDLLLELLGGYRGPLTEIGTEA